MATREHYRILGVAPGATWEEIQRRYRLLAWQYHPDHHPDDPAAASHFRQVAEAYDALRQVKDRPRRAAQNYLRPRFRGKKKIFEEVFGIEGCGSPVQQSPGADFRYDLQISLHGAMRGLETEIQALRIMDCGPCRGTGLAPGAALQDCPDCLGRGRQGGPGLLRFGPRCRSCQGRGKINAQACPHCGGLGQNWQTCSYHLLIPPGTEDGARLNIKGEGGLGFQNGPPGNLNVIIHVEPHAFFTRRGNDLYCQFPVSFARAALGGAIKVPTLDGWRRLTLPRGTQTGKLFRLPGGGAAPGPQQPAGDQIVEVVVTTPGNLSPGQKRILEEFALLERQQASGC
jgi:molecular chaperone DnaJ